MPAKPREPVVRITVDDKDALPVEDLLDRYRDTTDIKTVKAMRSVVNRAKIQPAAHIGQRIAVYVVEAVDELIAKRPGKGHATPKEAPKPRARRAKPPTPASGS